VDAEYFRKRRKERRKKFLQLLGGKCENCGTTKNLQFDHLDPKTKSRSIGKIWHADENEIEDEVLKCQLLCEPCHRAKTLEKAEYGKESDHGTIWRYKKHKCRCDECRKAMSDYYYSV